MTTPEEASADALQFGMYDHYIPGVKAGSYTLRIESSMRPSANAEALHDEVKELEFVVDAPRFALVGKEEVRACSPPHGGCADYRRMLPHIVLDKRALPWERPIDPETPAAKDRSIPWMALLLLTKEEMVADGAMLHDIDVEHLKKADEAGAPIYNPWRDRRDASLPIDTDDEKRTVTVVDSSADLFRRVCPRINELSLLAHVRRVRLDQKHDDHSGEEGDFAVLCCNRLVQPGANVVLLVSLEGWRPWLERASDVSDASRVRVVVLHSWHFTSDDGDGSFAAHVKKLDVGLFHDREAMEGVDDPTLESMMKQGYTAIAYQPEGTGKTFAWYRGPLSPAADAPFDADHEPFYSADSAIVVEKSTGMLDISFSAAWQMGRLLALGSTSFGQAIRHWNHLKQLDYLAQGQSERTSLAEEMAAYAASHAIEEDQRGAAFDDVKTVSEWLVGLRLLHPLPFRYLVAATNLSPPESLRFFYVDENWLDALTDGALSLGASSSSTRWFMQSNRGALRIAIRRMMARSRRLRRKLPVASNAEMAKSAEHAAMCGFLLRSSLLDRFPGIEIELSSCDAQPEKLEVLRMEFIGNGILFVLVLGKPTSILFKVPRESMTFSYDEVGLRPRVTDSSAANVGARASHLPPIAVDEYHRRTDGAAGVLDIRRLANELEGSNTTSGARFALHWLNAPDDVMIQWKHASETGRP